MSDASSTPSGSSGSFVALVSLHGAIILLLMCTATVMGWLAQLDATVEGWMSDVMNEAFAHSLTGGGLWLVTALIAFGLPASLLSCSCGWQRLTLWLVSMAVVGLWVPVLCLASYRPEISMAWIATALSGLLVTFQLYWVARKEEQAS